MFEVVVIDIRNLQKIRTINLAWEIGVSPEYLIGRDPSCDLVLDDILIGRIHGKFSLHVGNYYYYDLGSRNGSKVNNTVAKPDRKYLLKPLDTITLGNYLFWIKATSSLESPAANSNIPPASAPQTKVFIPPPAMSSPPPSGFSEDKQETGILDYEEEELSFDISPNSGLSFDPEGEFIISPEESVSYEIKSPGDEESFADINIELSTQVLTSTPKTLYRYPYLDCPDRLPINQEFSLFVQILIQAPEPKIVAMIIEDRGKPEELPKLEIVLRARGFELKGSNTKTIQIDRNDDTEARFVLIPRQVGEQQIRVDFYQHDKRIGTTRRNIFIGATDDLASVEIVQPSTNAALEIKNQLVISPPDLELCIELDRRDRQTLYFTLHSTKPEIDYHHKKVGQITLEDTPEAKILSVYQELNQLAANLSRKLTSVDSENIPSTSQNNFKIAEERITSVGNKLWD